MNNDKLFEFLFAGGGTWNITLAFIDDVSNVFRLINAILGTIMLICALVVKIVKWYKRSKADGKITADEVIEGVEIISEGAKEIKNTIDGGTKDGN